MHSKVTIAIPTLNRAEYLRIALDSALAQSYSNLEIVVSNNACTDQTANVLKSVSDSRLHVLEQKTKVGMMENWNACLEAASGKYFLLLSDDDVLEPTAIEEMVDAFEESESRGEKIGIVYCRGTLIDGEGKILDVGKQAPAFEHAKELILGFLEGERYLWPCAILFRKDDLAPGYDVRFSLGADAVQWMRAVIAYGAARFVDQRLTRYRVHLNASASTHVDTWCKENIALGEFAIHELGASARAGDDASLEIRKAVQRFNIRITSDIINQSLRGNKSKAFLQYWANYKTFASIYGFKMLMIGVAKLMLPNFLRTWLRSRLHGAISL